MILAHNHPSGDPTPSQSDINITHKIKEALALIDACVTWDGTDVFSYTIPNEESHKKIAIDRNGKVHVTGYGTNTIQRLHSDGTVDCVVLNKGDEVKRPVSVCFNKNCDMVGSV